MKTISFAGYHMPVTIGTRVRVKRNHINRAMVGNVYSIIDITADGILILEEHDENFEPNVFSNRYRAFTSEVEPEDIMQMIVQHLQQEENLRCMLVRMMYPILMRALLEKVLNGKREASREDTGKVKSNGASNGSRFNHLSRRWQSKAKGARKGHR